MSGPKSLLEALEDKVRIGDGCWEWTAHRDRLGYGRLWRDGSMKYAHRVIYELIIGPVPEELELDHLCRNRGCVRPSHLEPVTHAENMRRGRSGWDLAAKTHCPRGHPYDEVNTRRRRGRRECRACGCERARERRRKRP